MKKIIFIFNVPAFYKLNLLRELAKEYQLTVIFLGMTNQVITEAEAKLPNTDIIFLSKDDTDIKWRGVKRALKLKCILKSLKYDYIVYNGWDNAELICNCLATPKSKNCVISESSIFESRTTGIRAFIKRLILKRFSHAFVSGQPHQELLHKLNYKGPCHITGSVGVNESIVSKTSLPNTPKKYIYIGRLIDLKNLEFLIECFNKTDKLLTIVGEGPLQSKLKNLANKNITFTGFMTHEKVADLLSSHDCLILPSKQEPWGLVVEEALKIGIPVLVSDKVGSGIDLVRNYNSGVIFNHRNHDSLLNAIEEVERNYDEYQHNAKSIDFSARDKAYIDSFRNVFKLDSLK